MSGLMRNVVDQVLRSMGEKERAEQVNYVTDRMIERMGNEERVALLLAIIDRVMSNLSQQERADLATQVVTRVTAGTGPTGDATPAATVASVGGETDPDTAGAADKASAPVAAGEPPHPLERD